MNRISFSVEALNEMAEELPQLESLCLYVKDMGGLKIPASMENLRRLNVKN